MKKDDLKSLVIRMYENLLENINNQEKINKEQVINYLRDAIDDFSTISDDKTSSIEHAKSIFDNAYKEIANKSISSYKHTNQNFEQLSQIQKETINNLTDTTINISEMTEKFGNIQSHMISEVKKANDIISQLSTQVETLERNSNLDSLTNVFNRRALTNYLGNICSKQNLKYDLHLLMIDIDDFKKINDTYGHLAGDKILIFLTNILKKTLRDGDKIFRYGGEEFILILNRIDVIHCKKIATRLLELISNNKLIYKGESLNITISIGSTTYDSSDTPDSLIARADKALYRAKETGKNRIYTESIDGI